MSDEKLSNVKPDLLTAIVKSSLHRSSELLVENQLVHVSKVFAFHDAHQIKTVEVFAWAKLK